MTKKSSGKPFLLGAMIGSSLGALSVWMLKTKKGSAFQKTAKEKLYNFEKSVEGFITGGTRKVAKTMKTIRKTVQKVHKKIRPKK